MKMKECLKCEGKGQLIQIQKTKRIFTEKPRIFIKMNNVGYSNQSRQRFFYAIIKCLLVSFGVILTYSKEVCCSLTKFDYNKKPPARPEVLGAWVTSFLKERECCSISFSP